MAKSAHALFSASGSYKWLACAAALAMEQGRPDRDTAAAIQGTMMHAVGECCLLNRIAPLVPGVEGGTEASFYVGSYPLATQEDGEAGPQFTEELVAPVDAYVNRVWQSATAHRRNLLFVERRVRYSKAINQPKSFGTADAIVLLWDKATKTYILEIHDFKGGVGFRVDADNNPQLMLYAIGALEWLGKKYEISRVRLFIHQGRITEVCSEWDVSIDHLVKFAALAEDAARNSRRCLGIPVKELKPADFGPSEKGCRWCKAQDDCKAHSKYISNMSRGGFVKPKGSEPMLTPEDLAIIAKGLPEMKRWLVVMEERLIQTLSDGGDIPGQKLVIGRNGARVWKNEKRAARILSRAGLEAKKVLLTPAQAEKALKKQPGVWAKLQGLISQSDPSLAIVDRRDPRPKYGAALKSEFDDLS